MSGRVRRMALVAVGSALALAGCDMIRESAGIEKRPPDEFRVVRNAPLSLPPNFELRPPEAGARALPQLDPRREAQQVAFGRTVATGAPVADSSGEDALLRTLRVGDAPADIRSIVDEESAILAADNRGFVERLMFWREEPPPGTLVDARGEAQRIQENAALGRPPQTGTTPTIERKTRSGISLF